MKETGALCYAVSLNLHSFYASGLCSNLALFSACPHLTSHTPPAPESSSPSQGPETELRSLWMLKEESASLASLACLTPLALMHPAEAAACFRQLGLQHDTASLPGFPMEPASLCDKGFSDNGRKRSAVLSARVWVSHHLTDTSSLSAHWLLLTLLLPSESYYL